MMVEESHVQPTIVSIVLPGAVAIMCFGVCSVREQSFGQSSENRFKLRVCLTNTIIHYHVSSRIKLRENSGNPVVSFNIDGNEYRVVVVATPALLNFAVQLGNGVRQATPGSIDSSELQS